MDTLTLEKIKASVDPDTLLLSLGFVAHYSNETEIRCACILHGGDNKTAFCFKKESKRFCCYTHGCELDSTGRLDNDVVALVMKTNKCSFVEAIKYLSMLTGISIDNSSHQDEDILKHKKKLEKDSFIRFMEDDTTVQEIPESIMEKYEKNGAEYFYGLGISEDIISKYRLGSGYDSKGVHRGMIPILDEHGRLVGVSGRRTDNEKASKYLLMEKFQKRKILYNLNNALEFTNKYKQSIIIVEGFKVCWHVSSSGFPNVVAIMGKSIRPEQVNLLVKYGIFNVILLLDGDDEGKKGMEVSRKLLDRGKINVLPIYLPDKKSPDDFSCEEISSLISMFLDSIGG